MGQRPFFWRSGRDLNPRAAFDGNTISSRARYDHFDTTAYKMLPQQHGLLYQKSAPCQAKSTKKPINFGGGPLAALLHAIPSVHLLGNGLQRRIHCVPHPLHGFAYSGFSRLRPGMTITSTSAPATMPTHTPVTNVLTLHIPASLLFRYGHSISIPAGNNRLCLAKSRRSAYNE